MKCSVFIARNDGDTDWLMKANIVLTNSLLRLFQF